LKAVGTARGVVLVVDDDREVSGTLADILEDAGYQVMVADDGMQALDLLRRGPRPSLVLLDLRMPRMDGFQFQAEKQRDPALDGIPVVVFTADRTSAPRAGALDVAAYVEKPARLEDLLAIVHRFH
jgi:CheY-like chemotaxis protein